MRRRMGYLSLRPPHELSQPFRSRCTEHKRGITSTGRVIVERSERRRLLAADPDSLTDVDGTLFFTVDDGTHGRELWRSDGTESGTALVKDIRPGTAGSGPSELVNVDGTLFFMADNGEHGQELWKSDGTADGTLLVRDITPGPGHTSAGSFTASGSRLYFMTEGGLWSSNGTAAGTVEVMSSFPGGMSDENPVGRSIGPIAPTSMDLYFVVNHLSLYGMSFSTVWFRGEPVFNATEGGRDSLIGEIAVISDAVYFNIGSAGLWKHEAGQSTLLRRASVHSFTPAGDQLYFLSGGDLWRTDGTEGGTTRVKYTRSRAGALDSTNRERSRRNEPANWYSRSAARTTSRLVRPSRCSPATRRSARSSTRRTSTQGANSGPSPAPSVHMPRTSTTSPPWDRPWR